MTDYPIGSPLSPTAEEEQTFCYGHPKTPTKLRCTRCDRPICGQCAIPASVGQHCPECVADARRSAPRVRTVLRATAPAVMALIAINVGIFVVQRLVGDSFTARFSSWPPFIFEGEWWRPFTAMFLHSPYSLIHIGFNMYVLYIYGPNVEQAFGAARFVAMYLIAGLVASATSFAFNECAAQSVGASGAIFGLVGVLAVYLYNRRESAAMAHALRGLTTIILLNLALGFFFTGIDKWAHMGGLAAGALLGFGFDRRRLADATRIQVLTALGVLGIGIALFAYRLATYPEACQLPG
ncbi:MAG: rhomboid family intramembrane serine protease [Actinomycetota bacterium]|nr:rhomboid family intramembrane serine protease [Actinomycetota bacterium]